MHLLIVICALFASALADKLDNVYLPPSNAQTAGGNSKFLNAPLQFRASQEGSSYTSKSGEFQQQYARKPQINIVRYDSKNDGLGNYAYAYQTENKINVEESNQLRNVGTDNEINVVRGSYSYSGPDDVVYTVNYIVDENGYQASGAHLPTPPPIPEAILKSLEYNAQHPEEDNIDSDKNNQFFARNSQNPEKPSFNSQSGYRY